MARRIKVERNGKDEIASAEDAAIAYWLVAKQELRIRREREVKARAKRRRQQP
jgi:hypothetical protein